MVVTLMTKIIHVKRISGPNKNGWYDIENHCGTHEYVHPHNVRHETIRVDAMLKGYSRVSWHYMEDDQVYIMALVGEYTLLYEILNRIYKANVVNRYSNVDITYHIDHFKFKTSNGKKHSIMYDDITSFGISYDFNYIHITFECSAYNNKEVVIIFDWPWAEKKTRQMFRTFERCMDQFDDMMDDDEGDDVETMM